MHHLIVTAVGYRLLQEAPLIKQVLTHLSHDEERTLLFADDHHVLYRAGTRRIATPPTRHPANPLIAPTEPWERSPLPR